jgi:phosphoenolpyruvate synthase/pyruvate phosphate dikinase
MADTLIKNFAQISKKDTDIAGGKGASLGEMTQAGIPVPEGFVILSNAFERFIEETDLNVEIDAILDTVDIKEIHTVENASEKIQAIILSKEMPEDIKAETLNFYNKLDCKFVAVRSSATSEDSVSAAWAGQLDSFLNTTDKTLLENVKRCWASLFTPRAVFYRFEKKLNKDKISVAVVVQKMVDSEESGIAFSVHPVTQDENQIIIEAGFGLGEAIVSGSITPDSYVIDKQGFDILDINVNEQTKALYKKTKGGNEWKELGDKGRKQVLTEKEIIELSKLIVKIENHYGFPCDIEWAKEKGKFYIVQSRPITTLKDKIRKAKTIYVPFGKLVPSRARPKKVCPPFPAMYTQEYVGTSDMKKIYGYRAHATILTWVGDDITTSTDSFEDAEKIGEMIISKSLSDKNWLNELIEWSEKKKNSLRDFIEKELSSQDLSSLTNIEVAKKYFKYYKMYRNFHLKNTPSWWLGTPILERELDKYVQEKDISKENLGILLESLNYSFDLNKEEMSLLEIATKLRGIENLSENNLPKEVKKLLSLHIKDYSSIPFAYVSGVIWDIKFFMDKIKQIISEGDPAKILKKKNEELKLKRQKQNKLLKDLNLDKRLKNLVEISHKLSYLQDLKKIYQTRSHPHLQLCVLPEIAERLNLDLKYMGFLTPYEIRDSLISGGISKELEIELSKRAVNSILILKDNQYKWILEDEAIEFAKEYGLIISTENVMEFKGNSASSGNVKGIVKVCETSKEIGKIKKGDVLVASMTTPDYVPAMKIAGAIVTDEGGITCHAAIVSRELGIPCIIGTKNATKVLEDGDLVEVDANQGIVKILKKIKCFEK